MASASRIHYNQYAERDYTDAPTHVRVYSEDQGDDWPWCVDGVDDVGNYTEDVHRFGTHAEAIEFAREYRAELGARC